MVLARCGVEVSALGSSSFRSSLGSEVVTILLQQIDQNYRSGGVYENGDRL
ncbi:hypothetical protein PsAD26_04459 [Pseudovibrio sp. Ad26]|nr:hypothetical protein PsAD26_04459 [Pseudovibrio sp. Ad26]KZL23048.1 hypothetical protein PsWM33_03233 [Pseudovibrio sp. WM33]